MLAWWSGKRVAMTDMPQMIALYNGMGGGAAAAIAAVELYKTRRWRRVRSAARSGAPPSAIAVRPRRSRWSAASSARCPSAAARSRSASCRGSSTGRIRFSGQQIVNILILVGDAGARRDRGTAVNASPAIVTAFFVLALVLGVTMTLPIGGADMPVVISLYNALTGLAVAFEGFVLNNAAMIIAGTVVGSAGTLLTQLMAKAMNRSLGNVLFSGFGDTGGATTRRSHRRDEADRGGGRRRDDGVRAEGHHRAGLRHGGRAGAAQDLGAVPAAHRSRRQRCDSRFTRSPAACPAT